MSAIPPIRAAQCKCHDPWKAVPADEIQAEVEKAENFEHRLDVYVFMTSAKRSKDAQDEVFRLNQEHNNRGLFQIELMEWEDFEEWFDENPGVYDQIIGRQPKSTAVLIDNKLTVVRARVDIDAGDITENSFDAEIDLAKSLLEQYKFAECRWTLERLWERHCTELSPRQKYRVLGNIGSSYLADGRYSEAAEHLIEAKAHQPDDEKARTSEAVAYELREDEARAFELATQVRKDFPHSARALAIWIRNAPQGTSSEDLEKQIPSQLTSEAEVLIAVAVRAFNQRDFLRAERLTRQARDASPEWPPTWLLLGQALLGSEWEAVREQVSSIPFRHDSPRVREADECLSKGIELARSQNSQQVLTDALLAWSISRKLLGDDSADEKVLEAYRLKPEYPNVLIKLASIQNDPEQSIQYLRKAVQLGGRDHAEFLLAISLRGRDDARAHVEATDLFVKVARQEDSVYRKDAIGFAIASMSNESRWQDGHALLDSLSAPPWDALCSALRAKLYLEQGDVLEANRHADLALAGLSSELAPEDRRLVAQILAELGRHADGLPLWQQLATPGKLDADTQCLIQCANHVGRDDIILATCRHLRQNGIDRTWILHQELDLLQRYDVEEAVRVLEGHLSSHHEDRLAKLRLCVLGVLLQRPELVTADLNAMPSVAEVTPSAGCAVVRVLFAQGRSSEAIDYGYQLLRRHFDDPEVHIAYFQTVMFGRRSDEPISHSGIAAPGSAVCFVEKGGSQTKWVVIEESGPCYPNLDEISSNDFLAQQLTGRKTGEEVILARASTQDRTGIIKEAMSKYLFRLRDSMENYQIRFPQHPWLEQVRVATEGQTGEPKKIDIQPLLETINRRRELVKRIEDLYKSNLIPIHAFAKWTGGRDFEAVYHLASNPDLSIRCCQGSLEERNESLAAVDRATAVVVDLTAIATLSLLGEEQLLEKLPFKPVISQATFVELCELSLRESLYGGPRTNMSKEEAGYVAVEITAQDANRWKERIHAILETVKKSCVIQSGQALAAIEPAKRKDLVDMFGHHGAESLVLASQAGFVLWTDDMTQAILASQEYGVRRIWTQLAIEKAVAAGMVTGETHDTVSAKLVGCGYGFTYVSDDILYKAVLLADHNVDQWPLRQALESLARDTAEATTAVDIAGRFVARVYLDPGLDHKNQAILVRILNGLAKRQNGLQAVRNFAQRLQRHFGLNVLGAARASEVIGLWFATGGGVLG